MAGRLAALRQMALAGYKVGLTVAPILRLPDWAAAYDTLFADVATTLAGVPGLDLTAELITHRFTPKSKGVLDTWYPGSKLEMDEALRTRKLTKFGSVKWVFPKEQMAELRTNDRGKPDAPPADGARALLDLTRSEGDRTVIVVIESFPADECPGPDKCPRRHLSGAVRVGLLAGYPSLPANPPAVSGTVMPSFAATRCAVASRFAISGRTAARARASTAAGARSGVPLSNGGSGA